MLVDRVEECKLIEQLLDGARGGKSSSLVIRGEPGIGKTALLEHAARAAAGMRVLRATGVESESELTFAGLHELTRPILYHLPQLPESQARALRIALALEAADGVDRFVVYAGTLSLLAESARAEPVLCIVDDAHWLDTASSEALVFAARRLQADGVVLLFAARTGEARSFDAPGLPDLLLSALTVEQSRSLLAEHHELSGAVEDRVLRLAEGNPLALLELPGTLVPEEFAGRELLDEPLRLTERIAQAYVARLRRLPSEARQALLVAACSRSGEASSVSKALRMMGLQLADLEEAEVAGLISVRENRVEFEHPLVRSAIYESHNPVERTAAHAALAAATYGEERAWHLADATITQDTEVEQALENAAQAASLRGAYAAAGRHFARAADFSEDRERAARLLLSSGQAFWTAGSFQFALKMADAALEATNDEKIRARAQLLRGRIIMWTHDLGSAKQLLLEEGNRVGMSDPISAVGLLAEASTAAAHSGKVNEAFEIARQSQTIAASAPAPEQYVSAVAVALCEILRGRGDEVSDSLVQIVQQLAGRLTADSQQMLSIAGVYLAWIERFNDAKQFIEIALSGRLQGMLTSTPYALAARTELEQRTGEWVRAYADGLEAVKLARDFGQRSALPFCLVTLARLQAMQGLESEARSNISEALGIAHLIGATSIEVLAAAALGVLELGRRDPNAAIRVLQPLPGMTIEEGLEEPATAMWMPDLIEAYIDANQRQAATESLAVFEAQAVRTGRSWALATVARVRGLLVENENEFEEHFEAANRLHELALMPFERARTELRYGERLRRARRSRDARAHLVAALDTFERLSAAPWAERARIELRAAGASRHPAEKEPNHLTPQELQVAMVVAQGASNKEAAAALSLSPKTIEFHLGNIYSKLGLRSRTELARSVRAN